MIVTFELINNSIKNDVHKGKGRLSNSSKVGKEARGRVTWKEEVKGRVRSQVGGKRHGRKECLFDLCFVGKEHAMQPSCQWCGNFIEFYVLHKY